MEKVKYEIKKNDAINRWLITEMKSNKVETCSQAFEADVNLYEHYVQIVYPVREQFLNNKTISSIKYYDGHYDNVYFPFESNRVDLTTFIHTPHHLWINTKSYVDVPEEGTYDFELYTCGGVKMWVNKEEVITFDPYTRNIPEKCNIKVKFKKGENEIAIYADELAERDVFFYYELRYVGETEIIGVLPVDENAEYIRIAERFLESCYVTRDCFYEGNVTIGCNSSMLTEDIILTYTAKDNTVTQVVTKGTSVIEIGDVTSYNLGGVYIELAINVGKLKITRNLSVGIYPKEFVEFEVPKSIDVRKRTALEFISKHGSNNVNKTIAILETQHNFTEEARKSLYESIEMIRCKADCADFYLPSMFYLWTKYKKYIPEEIMEDIKKVTLDFRYWIDEPGNDVMWYFSENHAMLFHVSQYLAGNHFKEEVFTASGRTGEEQYYIGKERLEEWFDTFFKYGYAEWNSATYIPVDLIGFFILYELAPDENIRNIAKKAIDFTFEVLVYNTFNGRMTSTFGRAYEDTLKVKELHDTNFILWISYGEGLVNFGTNSIVLYSISDYVPNNLLKDIELKNNEGLVQELMQGLGEVKTYSFRTNDYFISSARRFRSFEHGHQQHIMNVALGEKNSQFFVNHPGERAYSGGGRPCYWVGNGTMPYVDQYKNLMVMVYHIAQEEVVKFIHGYTPLYQYDEYEILDNWLFARVEEAYIGVYFNNGITVTQSGANTYKEVISHGEDNLVVVKCGSKVEFNSYDSFKNKLKQMTIKFDNKENVGLNDPQYGEIKVSTLGEMKVNNEDVSYNLTRVFKFENVTLE